MDGRRPVTIGIGGGTGAGKSTLANAILDRVGAQRVVWIPHDTYYRDLKHIPLHERRIRNFDHPDALDTHLLIANLKELQAGLPTEIPQYDFREHLRLPHTRTLTPRPVIFIEGILIFAIEELRKLLDVRIFVDAAPDVRFIRRLRRDIDERGRTMESVMEQYLKTVLPMHRRHVEPGRQHAHLVIPGGGQNPVAITILVEYIRALLAEKREA